jgi:hypothetical protein
MIHSVSDPARQLLTVTFSGLVTAAEMNEQLDGIRNDIAGLQPGFRFFTDLSDLECMGEECAPSIGTMMEAANDRGVSEVIRVVPDPRKDIGFTLMSRFHYSADVRLTTYDTRDEALAGLADADPSNTNA